jgi:hypothetical protein
MGLLANVEKRELALKSPSLVARTVGPLGGGSNAHKAKLRLHGIVELWDNSARKLNKSTLKTETPVDVRVELAAPVWAGSGS